MNQRRPLLFGDYAFIGAGFVLLFNGLLVLGLSLELLYLTLSVMVASLGLYAAITRAYSRGYLR